MFNLCRLCFEVIYEYGEVGFLDMLWNNLGLLVLRKNMDDKKRIKEIKNKVFDEMRKEIFRFFNVDYVERMFVCFICKWKKINKC